MTFDLADFQGASLMKCQNPQDDIPLADGSRILPDGIGTVPLLFCVNEHIERISLSGVRYCSKLDTKLISLGMLDKKGLAYSTWDPQCSRQFFHHYGRPLNPAQPL